jgi:hypothetical protein
VVVVRIEWGNQDGPTADGDDRLRVRDPGQPEDEHERQDCSERVAVGPQVVPPRRS